jgi:hypothetical protein
MGRCVKLLGSLISPFGEAQERRLGVKNQSLGVLARARGWKAWKRRKEIASHARPAESGTRVAEIIGESKRLESLPAFQRQVNLWRGVRLARR